MMSQCSSDIQPCIYIDKESLESPTVAKEITGPVSTVIVDF